MFQSIVAIFSHVWLHGHHHKTTWILTWSSLCNSTYHCHWFVPVANNYKLEIWSMTYSTFRVIRVIIYEHQYCTNNICLLGCSGKLIFCHVFSSHYNVEVSIPKTSRLKFYWAILKIRSTLRRENCVIVACLIEYAYFVVYPLWYIKICLLWNLICKH